MLSKEVKKEEIKLGRCDVSDYDATHYCKYCKKDVNMGTYNINITDDDLDLSLYTRGKIFWITEYIRLSYITDYMCCMQSVGMDISLHEYLMLLPQI